jgi:hypothetical protein
MLAEVGTVISTKRLFRGNVLNDCMASDETRTPSGSPTGSMMHMARGVLYDLGMTDAEIAGYFARFNYPGVETAYVNCAADLLDGPHETD